MIVIITDGDDTFSRPNLKTRSTSRSEPRRPIFGISTKGGFSRHCSRRRGRNGQRQGRQVSDRSFAKRPAARLFSPAICSHSNGRSKRYPKSCGRNTSLRINRQNQNYDGRERKIEVRFADKARTTRLQDPDEDELSGDQGQSEIEVIDAMKKWLYRLFLRLSALGVSLAASVFAGRVPAELRQSAAATPTPTPTVADEDEVIKVETEAVNVLFTAQDKNRRLLTDLKAGRRPYLRKRPAAARYQRFSRQIDLPLSLAILIDTSCSQERTLPEEKAAAISFLESVVRPARTRFRSFRSRANRRSNRE